MKESMTARVGRIISGGLNALVDSLEKAAPEAVMEEAIREVDGVVDEVRAELGKVIANRHLATQRIEQERQRHAELGEQIDVALREEREDLAEAGVARQLDIEAQLPVLEKAIAEQAGRQQELEGYVAALKAKKREMQEELQQFRASRRESAVPGSDGSGGGVEHRVDQAGAAFERIMQRSTGLAATHGEPQDAARLAELEELARKNRIRERLAAIKAGSEK